MKSNRVLQWISLASVVTVLILSLIYIEEAKEGIVKAIENCVIGIVPSLFLNCVISSVLIKCTFGLKPKIISSADYGIFMAFILGNICGYPIGAKALSELVSEKTITSEQAEKAICFSFASGPAYILGIVSLTVFNSKLLGFTAFVSMFLSNAVLYIFYCVKNKAIAHDNKCCKAISLTDAVMESINSSASSMISICSSIVFFSAILAIIKVIIPSLNATISAILEISNITSLEGNGILFFVTATVLLSFGGLCVHMQIKCLTGSSFGLKQFYLTRPIQLLLTAIFSSIGYSIVQNYVSIETSTSNGTLELSASGSLVPLICTAGMVLIALTCHKQKSDRN